MKTKAGLAKILLVAYSLKMDNLHFMFFYLIVCSTCFAGFEYIDNFSVSIGNYGSPMYYNADPIGDPNYYVYAAIWAYQSNISWGAGNTTEPIPNKRIRCNMAHHYCPEEKFPAGWQDRWGDYGKIVSKGRTDKNGNYGAYAVYGDEHCVGLPPWPEYIPEEIRRTLTPLPDNLRHLTLGQLNFWMWQGFSVHNCPYTYTLALDGLDLWAFNTAPGELKEPQGENANVMQASNVNEIQASFAAVKNDSSGWIQLPVIEDLNEVPSTATRLPPYKYPKFSTTEGFYYLPRSLLKWKATEKLFVNNIDDMNDEILKKNWCIDNTPFCFIKDLNCPNSPQTLVIKSFDDHNNLIDLLPITMYRIGPDKFMSDYFYPVTQVDNSGKINDWNDNSYTLIFVKKGGHLDVNYAPLDNYGDFNFDGQVDWDDYCMFAEHYDDTKSQQGYDILYDFDYNGYIDLFDFAMLLYDGWMREEFFGVVQENFVDFSEFATNWGEFQGIAELAIFSRDYLKAK